MKKNTERLPVLFIGHGSPMNAIEDNSFTRVLAKLRGVYPESPRAILCISAHWMTEGTWLTHMKKPKTIHDFHGFPPKLGDVQYPAPGSPEIAELISQTVLAPKINLDDKMWGLDHGTWSVLKHMYPDADVPVVQLSLDMTKPSEFHFELGKKLRSLRDEGVFIIGSGNIVHNLSKIKWRGDMEPYNWASEFDEYVKSRLLARDFLPLLEEFREIESGRLSVPSWDHYFPFLYVLGASSPDDEMKFEFEGFQNGSIGMRCVGFNRSLITV